MKTILITGINGFLGSKLAIALSQDYNVVGLEYQLDNLSRLKDYNFDVFSSSKGIPKDLFKKYKIDIVIHTATVYRKNDEPIADLIGSNILLPLELVEMSKEYGVEAFINTDSFFNNPEYQYNYLGEYTLSKRHAVEWLKTLQGPIKLVNMKLFHMYGPGDSLNKFITKLIYELHQEYEQIPLTSGEQKRDFIFVDDVVEAYRRVCLSLDSLDDTFTEIEVGSGEAHTLKYFVLKASELTGSRSVLLFGSIEQRTGEIMHSKANIAQLKAIGWKPSFNLSEGIEATVKGTDVF